MPNHTALLAILCLLFGRAAAAGSVAEAEALWLKADCLSLLGRHAEALAVVEGPGGEATQDRDRFLAELYYDWALDHEGRVEYDRAFPPGQSPMTPPPGMDGLRVRPVG